MATRKKDRGLVYLRRSSPGQEASLGYQVNWAITRAAGINVRLDAAPTDVELMLARRVFSHKALRLDTVTGADLGRPGFVALMSDALADPTISHIFIYKRDRFARPEEAMEMVLLEKKLLQAGITLVFSDDASEPRERGDRDVARDLSLYFAYNESGAFLSKHAERVIETQRMLATAGFRTGGNPPYGFVRVLVGLNGDILEELAPGRRVRQAGCHVRIAPKDEEKIAVWLLILDLADRGWRPKRIAVHLNALGIPSPAAGTFRTDNGVRHRVSGKWHPNTVRELIRNRAILGIQDFGRRAEGAHRRHGSNGPRPLTDSDRNAAGRAKVTFNDPSLVITAQLGHGPRYDPDRWARIQKQMDACGASQRGVPRIRDLDRFPLACRVVDLTDACGHPMYAQTSGKRRRYVCGRYTKTSGSECHHNHVDSEAALHFVLSTIRQILHRRGGRDKLLALLRKRAKQTAQVNSIPKNRSVVSALEEKVNELKENLTTVRRRLATEKDDSLYQALRNEYKELDQELGAAHGRLNQEQRAQSVPARTDPDQDVAAAIALLDDIERITTEPPARAEVNNLLVKLGIWLGLSFTGAIKGKTRQVRKLASGVLTFGDAPLPVQLYGDDNADPPGEDGGGSDDRHDPRPGTQRKEVVDQKRSLSAGGRTTAGLDGTEPIQAPDVVDQTASPTNCRREGVSFTKVHRSDWTRLELFAEGVVRLPEHVAKSLMAA